MYASFRARRRRRPAIAALGVALVLVLGACDTQPATDITHNAATLNARGACSGTMNGIWQYELRRVGGPWNSVGPLHPFACGASGAETAIQSHRATGLAPNTTYQYRIRAYENNSAREYFFDSTGADRGTNYDQFRTLPSNGGGTIQSSQVDGPDPPEQRVPCTPDSPTDACASNHHIGKKENLENRMLWVLKDPFGGHVFDVADHRVWLSWSYNRTTNNIRSIFRREGKGRCLTPVGTCTIEYDMWMLETCDRNGPDTCLFRRESDANVSFTYGVAFNRHLISCVGTRIRWDGTHVRNTWEGDCRLGALPGASTARVARVGQDDSSQKLVIGEGEDAVRVDRYLTDAQIRAFDRACLSRDATEAKCRGVALRLYRGLPAHVRRVIAPDACAAFPQRAWERLAPSSRCARYEVYPDGGS